MTLIINCEVSGCGDIDETAASALLLAKTTMAQVNFKFNDIIVCVTHTDKVEDVINNYRWLRARNISKQKDIMQPPKENQKLVTTLKALKLAIENLINEEEGK